MIQNEPTLAFNVSGNGICILSVEFLFNFFSCALILCLQDPKFESGKYEGQEVLLVRAYGSSFFSLGINIRFPSLLISV